MSFRFAAELPLTSEDTAPQLRRTFLRARPVGPPKAAVAVTRPIKCLDRVPSCVLNGRLLWGVNSTDQRNTF